MFAAHISHTFPYFYRRFGEDIGVVIMDLKRTAWRSAHAQRLNGLRIEEFWYIHRHALSWLTLCSRNGHFRDNCEIRVCCV